MPDPRIPTRKCSTAPDEILTESEMRQLALALADGRSPGGFTAAEFAIALHWARTARIRAQYLELVLAGLTAIDVVGPVVTFWPGRAA